MHPGATQQTAAAVTTGGAATPPDGYESWDDYMLEEEHRERVETTDDEARRGLKAMQLAPTLPVCRALLAGQDVPVAALDRTWARRYGIR